MLIEHPLPQRLQHSRLEKLMHRPESVVGQAVDRPPVRWVLHALTPIRTQKAVEDIDPFERQKGGNVHAVGDVIDRIFFRGNLRPHLFEHFGGNLAVKARHGVVKS